MVRTLSRRADTLPAENTTFVGRREEVIRLRRLLETSRLVTLQGPGGIGKTRLAIRAADELRRVFADGVWFADLSLSETDDGLLDAVASAFGMTSGLIGSDQAVRDFFADRHALIILDNCEHVIAGAAELAESLLAASPRIKIMATSREVLGLYGEAIMVVPTLSLPRPGRSDEVANSEAVALFEERAGFLRTDGRFSPADRAVIGDICYRLDGLPLAIELASVRLRALSLPQILERLSDPYRFLTGGSRTAPQRHRTLLSSIEWSAELCTEPERAVWAGMSIFVGGWSLEAAEYAVGDQIPSGELVDVVQSLVDKSMVVRSAEDPPRYRMLETIRDYGQQTLLSTGQIAMARRRQRDWCLELIRQAAAGWLGPEQAHWLDRLDDEVANLRAAIEFSLSDEQSDPDDALALLVPAWRPCWLALARIDELRQWLDRALDRPGPVTRLRTRAHILRAYLATMYREDERAAADLRIAETMLEQVPDIDNAAHLEFGWGNLAASPAEALVHFRAALDGYDAALRAEPSHPSLVRLLILVPLAIMAARSGEAELSTSYRDEALSVMEASGEQFEQSYLLMQTGLAMLRRGGAASGRSWIQRSPRLKRELSDQVGAALAVQALAAFDLAGGALPRAGELLGLADGLWRNAGADQTAVPVHADLRRVTEAAVREKLGPPAYAAAYERGRRRPVDEGIGWALGEVREQPATAVADELSTLTRREREIAALVAEGLTNREIAARLVIAQRTAEGHVERILVKLGFNSRAQIAAWMARR